MDWDWVKDSVFGLVKIGQSEGGFYWFNLGSN